MKPGERCTVIAKTLYGRTGRLFREAPTTPSFWAVRLDGVNRLQWVKRYHIIPQSRDHDFDWLRERNLL